MLFLLNLFVARYSLAHFVGFVERAWLHCWAWERIDNEDGIIDWRGYFLTPAFASRFVLLLITIRLADFSDFIELFPIDVVLLDERRTYILVPVSAFSEIVCCFIFHFIRIDW
jgi:hypothetical protein